MNELREMLRELKNPWLAAVLLFMIALIVLLYNMPIARAHDHANPANNDYLKSLYSKGKVWCCDGTDTDDIEDWGTQGGKYRVKFRGQWFDVPDEALVEGPNRGGGALLWMNKGYSGYSVRCFMPGTMT